MAKREEKSLLKIGVQSGGLFGDEDVDPALRMLKDAGIECVDFNMDGKLDFRKVVGGEPCAFFQQSDEALRAYHAPHKAAIERHGVRFHQMHAPFPLFGGIGNDAVNDELIRSAVKCLMLCEYLACPYLVVHPVTVPTDVTGELEWKINMTLYTRLIPAAKQYGVKICLENLFFNRDGMMTQGAGSDFDLTVKYIDTLNEIAGEEIFAFCFDLGHATLLGKNVRREINRLGSRLQVTHLHDNDGRNDLHLQPYSNKRSGLWVTDWEGLVEGLRDINYKGALCFETFNAMRNLPVELCPAMVAYIAAVGRYFAERIRG